MFSCVSRRKFPAYNTPATILIHCTKWNFIVNVSRLEEFAVLKNLLSTNITRFYWNLLHAILLIVEVGFSRLYIFLRWVDTRSSVRTSYLDDSFSYEPIYGNFFSFKKEKSYFEITENISCKRFTKPRNGLRNKKKNKMQKQLLSVNFYRPPNVTIRSIEIYRSNRARDISILFLFSKLIYLLTCYT